jgi:hypothetical protein
MVFGFFFGMGGLGGAKYATLNRLIISRGTLQDLCNPVSLKKF